ncbi:M23 family metallopeptidase [Alicyclobacillus fastidiosus]|uniref:M23 family metallopeptidase n=1 Tax=Alicyclobacillus fastidiosus TaxID=392011 RepID=A0ABV5AKL3_9BACL|nr:M23 family metallopeptidase [Alicyclobacillus fastidiosus]WEH09249.1 M23 family metallopeptidase [Alicyclobacillus fastidiosus]
MRISTGYGVTDAAHTDHIHQGIDFAVPAGTPVHSFEPGVVVNVTHEGTQGFGNAVWVKFQDGYTAVFGHLQTVSVRVGDKVQPDEVIATVGSTGHSTGPHLHLGIRDQIGHWVDPNAYLHQVHDPVVVKVGGDTISHLQAASDQWKDQVETWGQQLFGIPKDLWDAGTPHAHVIDPQNAITQALFEVFKEIGKALLHLAPGLLLVVCCGAILGAMIGSLKCRSIAGVSVLGTIIAKVMDNYAGG